MIRTLISMAMVLTISVSTCFGQLDAKADAAYGVKYVQERVVALPQDQFKPFLTVFGSKSDARFTNLVKSFDENATLKAIKDQTHFNAITHESVNWRDKYSKENPKSLVVKLQGINPDYSASDVVVLVDNQIPMSADALAKLLNREASSADCFRRRHNNNNVAPTPDTDPEPQPLSPPITPAPVKPVNQGPVWLSILVCIIAASAGLLLGVRRKWLETYY